ncbi:MAG: hypothetical protein JWO30_159 [Fibrobacteres bacterium]|nr:hypothetical protein [Fibrobacterota bacterium]
MARNKMISGLIAIMVGAGFCHENKRESRQWLDKSTQDAVQACHRNELKSAVNSYASRTMGRWEEAHHPGMKISGVPAWNAGTGFASSRYGSSPASNDVYGLRSLGRAEAWQSGQYMSERTAQYGDHAAPLATRDFSYDLRSKGRAEAYGTGTDYCEVGPARVERLGLR